MILDKDAKTFSRESIIFSTSGARKTGYPQAKVKSVPYFTPNIKVTSKWVKVNIRVKTIQTLRRKHKAGFITLD